MISQIAERDAYDMSQAVRLRGALDVEALWRALDALVSRHEALRTTLAEVAGRVVQRIAAPRAGVLRVVEVDSYEAARSSCVRALQRSYDLTAGPLFEPMLVRIGPQGAEDHVLLLRMHHAVADEWSRD